MKILTQAAFACLITLSLSASALADTQKPTVVNGVTALASGANITVSWNAARDNNGVEGYNIYRDGNWFDTVFNTTRYVDTKAQNGREHSYAVVAFDKARNFSTLSATTRARTGAQNQPSTGGKPAAPNAVSASRLNGSSAKITWNAPSGGANAYNIYRNGSYIATVHNNTTFIAGSLNAGSSYVFQVVAVRGNQFSTLSARASVAASNNNNPSPPPPNPGSGNPSTPTNLRYTVRNDSSVQLFWNAPAGGAEGYNINRNGSYYTTVTASTSAIVSGLNSQNSYRFSVASFRNGKFSVNTPDMTVRTSNGGVAPPPPRNPANTQGAVPAGYSLVFSEEFNQWNIDSTKWNTQYRWGPNTIINEEEQYYIDTQRNPDFGVTPFKFDGSNMTIEATRTPDWLRGKANGQDYLSGAMTTFQKFTMRYGYVEMRAKLPQGEGLWPAFWLLHAREDRRKPEIDVVEMLGGNPRLIYQTYHFYDNGNLRSTPSYEVPGLDYANQFHTFGMLWEPNKITWFVDGKETNRFEDWQVSDEDMYILVNLAMGGTWAGTPNGSTPLPARYQIDYIRAYQKR